MLKLPNKTNMWRKNLDNTRPQILKKELCKRILYNCGWIRWKFNTIMSTLLVAVRENSNTADAEVWRESVFIKISLTSALMLSPEFRLQTSSFSRIWGWKTSSQLEFLRGRWENNIKDHPSTSNESTWSNILEVKRDDNKQTEVTGRLIGNIVNLSTQIEKNSSHNMNNIHVYYVCLTKLHRSNIQLVSLQYVPCKCTFWHFVSCFIISLILNDQQNVAKNGPRSQYVVTKLHVRFMSV
jgi:hypothetical protein